MKYLFTILCVLTIGLLAPANAQTPSTSLTDTTLSDTTGWLTTDAGSKESTLGAHVISVDSDENATIIELEVPVATPNTIEEVTVIGRQPEEDLEQIQQAEWLQAYENGNYGLRIHLSKSPGFEFRLKFANEILMGN